MACPFCSAIGQTLRQEMSSMEAVVIAVAVENSGASEGEVKVKVVKVLKGEGLVSVDTEIESLYFGRALPGKSRFLMTGIDSPMLVWSTPLSVTEESEKYIEKILKLSDDPVERLKFYQEYLESDDPTLARDTYDEFAIAPYSEMLLLKDHIQHDKLVERLRSPDLGTDRRRLYLTMLGICGSEKDLPLLEELLGSKRPEVRGGLDALIACYLTLKGPAGLPVIEKKFLSEANQEYADAYAAIQALRFHAAEEGRLPKDDLSRAFALVLDRPDLADLVIPDLARLEDWSHVGKVVEIFKKAQKNNNWVRVPIVNYLRACPNLDAKVALEELEKIDPDSVRRSKAFFVIPVPPTSSKSTSFQHSVVKPGNVLAAITESARSPDTINPPIAPPANPFQLLAVFLCAGIFCSIAYWLVLTG
jgi:hypothetical protein